MYSWLLLFLTQTLFWVFVSSTQSPRLLQVTVKSPSVLIPQTLVQNIVKQSANLIMSQYQPFIAGFNVTNVEGQASNAYKITYSNGDLTYAATTIGYPNGTISLLDFRQIGWDAVSPYSINNALGNCLKIVNGIYQFVNSNLVGINHTFSNNIHNYSLRYQGPSGFINILVSYSDRDNSTKIYQFSAQNFQNTLFKELPINFSLVDSNMRQSFKLLSKYNNTVGFIFTPATYVSFIANAINNNGSNIIYYFNLITSGNTLEALLSFRFKSDPTLIYMRAWPKDNYLSDGYANINIINAWEDPKFITSYYNALDRDKNIQYVTQIQGSYSNCSNRRIVFMYKSGKNAVINY